ncbi:uncharacterized protein NEPG_02476 [Nematocida parisii ERTm1]|uniref:Uncharacterized protein n=1 Tax=Nematocida parisii (strain ERTm3) TaxID=935791 RepID=I3EJ41_NEMP3|nr:uncharacterized protein NEPG_02476 [Nematocida parisii ERTm1]EIJ89238.1 hypothetical protein NEQG_00008 [Nematocida parisii ERTm3]EIJ92588.1 hypothetical protein NEPG_02476 [Nematocida parisii ERTm1]|eukprot:XP_013060303.1 hypothetical protein NEPG_02476 [Nematocida parisii ERTm1]
MCFMFLKSLLRRRVFHAFNGVYSASVLVTGVYSAFATIHQLVFQIVISLWSLFVSAAICFLCFHRISILNMMHSMYLLLMNIVMILSIIFLRFLFEFQASDRFGILFESIPIIVICAFSFFNMLYIAYVRRCIIDGLIQPVFMQQRKKIESKVVFVRREYPEIFSIQ